MTVSEFIKRHGREAGPEGIAIFAYLKDSPEATCTEVARGIGMGKAALVRHALRLEELGLIKRTVDKNPNGLILPARLSIADPIQNGKGASDNTLAKSESLTKTEPLPNQHPYQNGDVDSKGVNLSDPIQNGKGRAGTPIAPSKAETISSVTTQPPPTASVDAGANAPRRPKPRPSELDKLSEPERVVIKAWHELTRHYPKLSVWPYILGRLAQDFDAERFSRCGGAYLANFGMGQQHVAGICDWYARNQTERNARDGPPGKTSNVERSMDAVRSFIAKEQAGNVR